MTVVEEKKEAGREKIASDALGEPSHLITTTNLHTSNQ
jgi:hypothetical protein